MALGQNVPLVMRGPAEVTSWSPSRLTGLDEDTLARITDLYAHDPLLSVRLADALMADRIASENGAAMPATDDGAQPEPRRAAAAQASPPNAAPRPRPVPRTLRARSCTRRRDFCARTTARGSRCSTPPAGTRTPTRAARKGQLAGRLAALDAGLATLKEQLGPAWKDTAVLLVTEFGRTAAINGTRGTDHGTATMALLVGGRWPAGA